MDMLRATIDETNNSKVGLKSQIEDLTQSLLTQVQQNRDTVGQLNETNQQKSEDLVRSQADCRHMQGVIEIQEKTIVDSEAQIKAQWQEIE